MQVYLSVSTIAVVMYYWI